MKTLLFLSFFSFTTLASTVVPFERDITRLPRPTFLTSQHSQSGSYLDTFQGDENDTIFYQGFSFKNSGPNEIVKTAPEGFDFASRDFSFVTDDHSRRDVYLWMTDYNGSGYTSDYYETIVVFLPRNNQIHIEENATELIVTLPTSETATFSKKTKMLTAGVLNEKALDFNPSRPDRKFAQVNYTGEGLMIRSDARASDPRLGKFSYIHKAGKSPCRVYTSLLWTQEGFPQFKYVTDEEVYSAIDQQCGADFRN